MKAALHQAWRASDGDDYPRMARWLGEAIVMAGGIPPNSVLGQTMTPEDLNDKLSYCGDRADDAPILSDPLVQLIHAVRHARKQGVGADDGQQGERLGHVLTRWQGASFAFALPELKEASMAHSFSSRPAPQRSKPRF